ncbi:c-type cytochrome [Piscinibacter sp.]|jgi:cytochrome c553|uniref:c-type cytochrome n=1 Tax=Piscinibacter sp. TaxID=1903157 RepID=UPI003559B6CE
MKSSTLALMIAAAMLSAGCANPTRSRDLANPNVTATTLAQQVCSNCHGLTGNAISPNFPNLAGQVEAYFVAQLNGFKSHGRQDPAGFEYMWGLSRSLTDDQIKGLAAYFAAQKPARQPGEGTASQVAAGKAIFENGMSAKKVPPCSSCHGAEGQGNGPFPRIAGQHADYLVKQLVVFQRTDERPEGGIMKTVAHELSAQDIENVAAYAQSMAN